MARPTYLDGDTLKRSRALAWQADTDADLFKLAFQLNADADIGRLQSMGQQPAAPPRPAPMVETPEPLPVETQRMLPQPQPAPAMQPVRFDEPAAAEPAIDRGIQVYGPPEEPAAAPYSPQSPVASQQGAPGAPGVSGAMSAPAGAQIDNSSREAFVRSAWPHMLEAAGGNRDAAEMMLAAAISENGSIGTGRPIWANNFFGLKGQGDAGSVNAATWEQTPGGPTNTRADFAAYSSPVAGFRAFFGFLEDNPRYAGALAAYRQTGDAGRLFQDVNAAGYATDPQWASKVANIRANQVAPITQGLAATAPSAGLAPAFGTYTAENLTPDQLTQGRAEGLTDAQALAICGPAAAVAFSRVNGRNPTLTEAKDLASSLGLWDESLGMHGPASQVTLLQKMGVPSRLAEGVDWNQVRAEVQAGRPVILDAPLHYYTVNGYDPATGEFELGQSAGVLRKSGGKTKWRPDQIPSLGMGDIRATIYMGAR